MRIDLHAHSAVSDGTDTPSELMGAAQRAQLDVVALTDHDTIAGWDEAAAAVANTGVSLVRGIEISCSADGVTVHLLGYLFNPERAGQLLGLLSDARASRVQRIEEMTARIARDYPITLQDVYRQAGDAKTLGRPHLADALVAAGVVPNRSAAFTSLLKTSSPYYVRYQAPDPVVVTELVRQAGGVPVLAHPRAAARQRRMVSVEAIKAMVQAGLFALEADHRDHNEAARLQVRELAAELGVETTGSSDYHGDGKPNRLGENLTAPAVYEQLIAQAELQVIRP